VSVVRAVLALVLCTAGALLGYQVGVSYISSTAIIETLQHYAWLKLAYVAGFGVLGVLLGVWVHQAIMRQLCHWSDNLRKMPADDKIAIIFGALLGVFFTFLISPVVQSLLMQVTTPGGGATPTVISLGRISLPVAPILLFVLGIIFVFFGIQGMMSMKSELRRIITPNAATAGVDAGPSMEHCKILDTNVIIDGRIADICRTGFLEGTIYVPGFVLDELQHIADSSDNLKRARGRRGLDILNQMQKELALVVRNYDRLVANDHGEPVDSRLVSLAREMNGAIVTNDFNLNKVAELQGVRVLNVNELANSMKPVVLPGEDLNVTIIKEGREPNQGIAYLDDGTMVVVENARKHVGEAVAVTVGSVLQTTAGKMIFGHLRDEQEGEDEMIGRNVRSYAGPRGGRRRPH
jgi:uncharacterized protein YacL